MENLWNRIKSPLHTVLIVIGVLAVVVVAWKMISDRPVPILEKFGSGGGDYYSLGAPSSFEYDTVQTSGSSRSGNLMAEAPAVMDEGDLTERKVIKNGSLDLVKIDSIEITDIVDTH